MKEYTKCVVTRFNSDLVGIDDLRWGKQLWTICRPRKTHRKFCSACWMYSEVMYRPSTNRGNRGDRLCPGCIDAATVTGQ